MRQCVFLDRDGVINQSPTPGDYVVRAEQVTLIPEVIDWIRLFNVMGYLVIVVTNQRGVARGLMSEDDLADVHRRIVNELAKRGARLDEIYYCPHEEDCCECRKPKPGLVKRAQRDWDIDLARSVLIGDTDNDEELARSCGLQFIRVFEGRIVRASGAGTPTVRTR